jgi:hypothetical protein
MITVAVGQDAVEPGLGRFRITQLRELGQRLGQRFLHQVIRQGRAVGPGIGNAVQPRAMLLKFLPRLA